jgi:hypothetical protein
MVEVTILIPIASNEGKAFAPGHHQVWERYVVDTFGGFSLLPGSVVGAWADGGVVFSDHTRAYVIAVDGILAVADKLRIAVRYAAQHYEQKSVYVRYLGVSEVLYGSPA